MWIELVNWGSWNKGNMSEYDWRNLTIFTNPFGLGKLCLEAGGFGEIFDADMPSGKRMGCVWVIPHSCLT